MEHNLKYWCSIGEEPGERSPLASSLCIVKRIHIHMFLQGREGRVDETLQAVSNYSTRGE